MVSRGAEMIEYWHWHTLHFGTETYWGGVLPHSGLPGRAYREIAQLGREFELAGDAVTGLVPDAHATFVYSARSRWALQAQPSLATDNGSPDPRSYQGIFEPFYRGAFDAKLQARIMHAEHLFTSENPPQAAASEHPTLVVPGLYVTSDEELDWLLEYAESGGHLILGPRTAYADDEARARAEVAPARLHEAAGVWYDEFSNIETDLAVVASPQQPGGLPALALGRGSDRNSLGGRTRRDYRHRIGDVRGSPLPPVARYHDAHLWRRPHHGGRHRSDSVLPSSCFVGSMTFAQPNPWRPQSESVTVTSATNDRGERVHFAHNWSWENATLTIPAPAVDVLTQEELPVGHPLQLKAWDVRVLRETRPSVG